ncbi:hypothetical protein GGX14DRAFT_659311 [Mycena pura]|uniref:F-box domain-containing protein n=1 Tax=Mycena pura TaxID=153505 RepID=A0AAD6V2G6_9AGAR|nr:hypothetical protein GGX14DRAFT_659311 [Mycena pura]
MQRKAASRTRAADRARVAEIAGEVAGIARELEDLGERLGLASLRLSVQALRSEEANIREGLRSYDPASVLPTEIVSEIFVHVLPPYPICPPLAGKSSPTQLTHVCRHWREIALSTPSLWRAITIPPESSDQDVVQTWLRRSGSCPLSLHMDKPLKLTFWSAIRVPEVIVTHRARWEYLSLYLWNQCSDLLEIIGPMPLLREMKLDVGRDWDRWHCTHSTTVTVFCEAPHLRSMTFVEHTFPSIGFPWSQLTSLSLLWIDVNDCSELLQQTVNLVHCKVCPFDTVDDAIERDLRLPRLESLELVQYDGPDVMEFLGTFIVPALLCLQVPEDDEHDLDHFCHSLSAFIAKVGCKLQELRITSDSYTRREKDRVARYRRKFASIPRLFYTEIFTDEECEITSDEDEDEDEE